jgi:hypothetical protein
MPSLYNFFEPLAVESCALQFVGGDRGVSDDRLNL